MQDYLSRVLESVSYINEKINVKPEIAIILGSGLGGLADEITDRVEIPYADIPNFPFSNVQGHENKLIIGKIYNKTIIAMQGRVHYYEGYSMEEVTFPIKVFALLGVTKLILSNAAGALTRKLKLGDLMLITDHINISGLSPLRGENNAAFGERFPAMKYAYSPSLIEIAKDPEKKIAKDQARARDLGDKIELKEGVYAFSEKRKK